MKPMTLPFVLSGSLLLPASAWPQQSYVLENASARYEFRYDSATGEVWLHEGFLKSDPSRVVHFDRTSQWDVELRVDPNAIAGIDPARGKVTEVASLLSFSGPLPFGGGTGVRFTWTFTLDADPALSEPDPQVLVNTFWQLDAGRDYLNSFGGFRVQNPAATSYRLWQLRFPRLAIQNLDAAGSGQDKLLSGIMGGRMYGNPILFADPYDPLGRGFAFSGETENADGLVSAYDVDPGLRTVPLTYYYHPDHGGPGAALGVYLANNDDEGWFKAVHVTADRLAPPSGRLDYEIVQFPADPAHADVSVFDAIDYLSPFGVHVGVLHGDWVDAAQKYRAYRTSTQDQHGDGTVRFDWLKTDDQGTPEPGDDEVPRPAGHPQNPHLPAPMKQNPFQIKIMPGPQGGYCVGLIDLPGVLSDYRDFIEPYFLGPGEVFPMVIFDRFQVAYDEVGYESGGGIYTPRTTGVMPQVHQLMQELGAEGHLVLLDSMTEKFWTAEHLGHPCDLEDDCIDDDGTPYSWCCVIEDLTGVDSELRRLTWESQQFFRPLRTISHSVAHLPCPAGLSAALDTEPVACTTPPIMGSPPHGTAWPPVFEDFVAQAIEYLDIQGGVRFNSVPSSTSACFSEDHDHPAGFGKHLISAWFDILENVRTKAGRGRDFYEIKEIGDSTGTRQVRVQNPLSFDLGMDFLNTVGATQETTEEWNRYFDSPVVRVPLLQMVADEVRFASQYSRSTLSLPWTVIFPVGGRDLDGDGVREPRPFFRKFPAVTGALQCWSMAKRALVHQGGVLLTNYLMAATGRFLGGSSREDRALQAMADFYLGLGRFLQAAGQGGKTNMEFVTGTMERSPRIRILGEVERFSIARSVIEHPSRPFPNLAEYLLTSYGDDKTFFPAGVDITFDAHRPVYLELFNLTFLTPTAIQPLPDEHESWLPHGMYRHWDGSDTLALLIANPWGVPHILVERHARHVPPTPFPSRPMNPFTFDYLDPQASPTDNTYSYEFTFDPADYGIDPTDSIVVERRTYDLSGALVSAEPLGTFQGTNTFQGSLEEFHFQSYYFSPAVARR